MDAARQNQIYRGLRRVLTAATLVYAVLPVLADLSPSHVLHPGWPPHARLHTVWLLGTQFAMGVVALYLLWGSRGDARTRIVQAGVLALVVLGAFLVAAVSAPLYGGALSDPGSGVPQVFGLDANLLVFGTTAVVVAGTLAGALRFDRGEVSHD